MQMEKKQPVAVQARLSYASWNVMVMFVVESTGWPFFVAGRKRICDATRRASSSNP
jgi:hypothetical protein